MITTSESLLDRLRTLDGHTAWQEFYRLYWGAILCYARKLGLDEHAAQEVLQETMVALMRILPGFAYDRRKGRFRNFLLTIVHRKSLAALRRTRRERDSRAPWAESEHTIGDDAAGSDREADAEAKTAWREALVGEAMRELKADPGLEAHTFAVFEAYVLEKKPATALAAEFGLKINAVYQIKDRLLRRIERRVAQLMRDSGE